MAKIADTVPERLRPFVLEPASRARPGWRREPDRIDMVRTRAADPRGQEDRAVLSRRTGPRQPAHDLADRDRLSRGGAATGGVVRTAQGFSQFSNRPRRRRGLSRREISGAARPRCGRNGGRAWSGSRRRIPDADRRRCRLAGPAFRAKRRPWNDPTSRYAKAPARPAAPAALFVELAALHHRGRRGARSDSGKIRQRKIVGNALRRRPLLGAVRQGRRGDGVRDLCGAARSLPHLHARRCRMRRWRESGTDCRCCRGPALRRSEAVFIRRRALSAFLTAGSRTSLRSD